MTVALLVRVHRLVSLSGIIEEVNALPPHTACGTPALELSVCFCAICMINERLAGVNVPVLIIDRLRRNTM